MTQVKITDIHKLDRYHNMKEVTVGRVLTLRDDVMEAKDSLFLPGWKEALCTTEDGSAMFFIAVKFEEVTE